MKKSSSPRRSAEASAEYSVEGSVENSAELSFEPSAELSAEMGAPVSASWTSVRQGAATRKAGPFRMTGPGRTRTRSERAMAREATPRPTTRLERAQALVYKAWKSSRDERPVLARKALRLSSACADAHLLLAEDTYDPGERLACCRRAVKAGVKALGRELPADGTDHWERLEARPWLRARAGLARALWECGRLQEALAEYRALMARNAGDNLGLRYLVLPLMLEMGLLDEASALAGRWQGEPSGEWSYNLALMEYARAGASPAARAHLAEGLQASRQVLEYLLGLAQIPSTLPDAIEFGGEDEAVDYALRARRAWERWPGALDWIAEVALGSAG